jgi:hypothetical protein
MIYEILDKEGNVVNKIVADKEFVDEVYPGQYRLVGPEPIFADPSIITKIAMITRFLDAEYTGILAASKNDIEVQGWLDRFYAANSIDLGDNRTIDGINMMVSKGLLLPDRATEILTAPVKPEEKA